MFSYKNIFYIWLLKPQYFILPLLGLFLLNSCSVQQRHYTKGFYTSYKSNAHKEKHLLTVPGPNAICSENNQSPLLWVSRLNPNFIELGQRPTLQTTITCGDTLTLVDGKVLLVKILEITPALIKYKRCDNIDGIKCEVDKELVVSIKYLDGKAEIINEKAAEDLAAAKKKPKRKPNCDTLFMMDSTKINCKVKEIGQNFLGYKACSNNDDESPLVIIPIDDILKIKYFFGRKEVKIYKPEAQSINQKFYVTTNEKTYEGKIVQSDEKGKFIWKKVDVAPKAPAKRKIPKKVDLIEEPVSWFGTALAIVGFILLIFHGLLGILLILFGGIITLIGYSRVLKTPKRYKLTAYLKFFAIVGTLCLLSLLFFGVLLGE